MSEVNSSATTPGSEQPCSAAVVENASVRSERAEAATPISSAVREHFDEFRLFVPQPVEDEVLESVVNARAIADTSSIEKHPFFELAAAHPDLLRLWVSQECVVTGPFSQLLLRVASEIHNVHLRTAFLKIVDGEHGPIAGDVAHDSHPYLLYRLSQSVGLNLAEVEPLDCTIDFLVDVERLTQTPLTALGVLGVGNERLLLTEYAAVRSCFDSSLPEAEYSDFLSSNIEEDLDHSAIAERIAAALVSGEEGLEVYFEASRIGVAARIRYYDRLVEFWNRNQLPSDWTVEVNYPDDVTDMEKN